MDTTNIEKLAKNYERGAKKVSFRSYCPVLAKGTFEYELKSRYGNYDLHFNRLGRLIHSFHFESGLRYSIMYGYNKIGKVVSAMKIHAETQIILGTLEVVYDKQMHLMSETSRRFDHFTGKVTCEKMNHDWELGKLKIYSNDFERSRNYEDLFMYDDFGRIKENHKAVGDERDYYTKFEYDPRTKLTREIETDCKGVPTGVYCELFPKKNGLDTGYLIHCDGFESTVQYNYTFNEEGHWVSKVALKDDVPWHIYEREIEYR